MCFGGIGTVTSAIVALEIINPYNGFPGIKSQQEDIVYNYFEPNIANNVPEMLSYYAIVEIFLLFICASFIWLPPY